MRILYFDCFSGASGDMIVGALIDAGVPLAEIREALGGLAGASDAVWTDRVTRAGVRATKFCVRGEDTPIDHAHDHERGHDHAPHSHQHEPHVRDEVMHHGAHRSLDEICRLIDGSSLSGTGKDRAKQLFTRLAEAEAAIHGTPLEKVHLHEVGALDSIVDIVGAVFAIEAVRADRIVSSPLNVGSGSVRSAHGLYPVPAPATVRLLEGVPIYSGPQKAELVTPTGALIVSSYASEFGRIPPMRIRQVGYGAGSRDFADSPNVLRVLIGDADPVGTGLKTRPYDTESGLHDEVVVIEAEIDDMNPQIFGVLMDRLLADGALDVFYTPIQMKKNRPGTLLSVIARPEAREPLTSTIFREATTIGVRYREMMRDCLERDTMTVQTAWGPVRIKVARRGTEVLNAAPEFDDCAALARTHDVPVKDVYTMAVRAYLESQRS